MATYQAGGPTMPTEALLTGVAALSPDNVWVTGELSQSNNPTFVSALSGSLIEHWNGSTWSLVPVPGAAQLGLTALTALSASDIWAVGQSVDSSGDSQPAALHWDGHSWSAVSIPGVSGGDVLYAVSGSSASDIWAAGKRVDPSGTKYAPLAEHWNGRAWSVVAPQEPPSTGPNNEFDGVAAISPSDAWAVGSYWGTRAGQLAKRLYLLEHWNGQKWSIVGTPQTADPDGLRSVAATSAANVWIAGSQQLPATTAPAYFADDPYNLHTGCSRG
jgi:hypothetical protein